MGLTDLWGLAPQQRINPKYMAQVQAMGPDAGGIWLAGKPDGFLMVADEQAKANAAAQAATNAKIPGLEQRLSAFGAAMNPTEGTVMNLGNAGLPGTVGAPSLALPDYGAADAAFAQAKPTAVTAPQYVQANYTQADQLWKDSAPKGLTEDDKSNDMWGKILSGAAQGFIGGDFHGWGPFGGGKGGLRPGWGAIIGALGGYGSALENRTKMSTQAADKMSDFMIRQAGYETGKAKDIADTTNLQQRGNFDADVTNNTNLTNYARALGGYESGKAETRSSVQNRQAELGYQANVRNAQINAEKRGAKVIGHDKNQVIYSYIDKDGNLNVATKPVASMGTVNGRTGGKMASTDPGAAGMEQLISTLRSAGQLRNLLGPEVYDQLAKPYTDYSTAGTPLGSMMLLGDKGKNAALERAQAEENAAIANYLYNNPDVLERGLTSVLGK